VTVIYIVLPLALLVVTAAVVAYVWAARSGQFDDTETPAIRPLIEDDETPRARPGEHPDASEK
jgi:cbb3-type cytochrome oxidase maturation protein